MIKKQPLTKLMLSACLLVSFYFISCQKEQMPADKPVQQDLGATMKTEKTSATSDADKAFDKAVKEIMQNMMQQMHHMEMTCDPDIDFANMMIMHHEAGIQMADAELMYGHDAEAKALAEKTKVGNQESKERLEAFLASHPTPEPQPKEQCKTFMKEMDEAMKAMMMCMQKALDTDDVDVDFANQMICHHQGAIAMSRVELKWGNDEAALSEARTIIEEQSQEIIELSDFINHHGMPVKH